MMKEKKLYKVLVDGQSCSGGDLKWSLPTKKGSRWIPGNWHEVTGEITICRKGLHLTTQRFNWYKWGCTAYEAEAEDIKCWEEDKCVCKRARLLKEVPHPKWWIDTCNWIETLKNIAWLKPDGNPKKEWQLYPTRDAAGDAAGDAALYARGLIVADQKKFEQKHRTHINKRMEVWQKGYGLLCDVNGVLYVYEKI